MASRAIVVAMILMLVGMPFPRVSSAQSSNPASTLELGYGPSTLRSITDGVPVYTVGDQLWATSTNSTIVLALLLPNSSAAGAGIDTVLTPGIPVPLYTFAEGDPEGTWSLHAQTGSATAFDVPVQFLKLSNHRVLPRVNSSLLQRDIITSSFSANFSDAYDIQTCFTSSQSNRIVPLALPSSIGAGSLGIQRNGSALVLSVNGSIASPFTFWFEVYHPYSYAVPGAGELISRDVKSVESTPVLVQSLGRTNTTLTYDTHLRNGRSTMRAFFDNARGLTVEEASLLISGDGSWIQLGSCGTAQVSSQTFSYATSLADSPATWPTNLYLMYRISGVEGITTVPVRLNASRVSFVVLPWGVSISSGLVLSNGSVPSNGNGNLAGDVVAAGTLGTQLTPFGGSLYLVSDSYPATIAYTVRFFGQTRTVMQTIAAPYTVNLVPLDSAKLNVRVLNGSRAVPNAQVQLATQDSSISVSVPTGGDGLATFFVPGGNYTATVSFSNQSQTQHVSVINGNQTSISMTFTVRAADSAFNYYLEVGLAVMAGVGVLANILVIVVGRRPRPVGVPG